MGRLQADNRISDKQLFMEERNKRIAKNTLVLYFRTLITTLIGFYSGRLCLEALGIDNYGIQNVVGGIIAFSGLITNAVSSAGTRFLLVATGKGDLKWTRTVFSSLLGINTLLAIAVLIFLETGGLIFLNFYADIPEGKMFAANWLLQCSIFMLCLRISNGPFGSVIMANERFSFLAWKGILTSIVYIGLLLIVLHSNGERLILYANLTTLSSILDVTATIIFSKIKFPETNFSHRIHKSLFKKILSFSGWNLFGNTAFILNNQGVNLLINMFFGVVANAAKGVATAVTSAIMGFVSSFSVAFKPQITKLYAAEKYQECYTMANRAQKTTWFLIFLFIVPAFFEANKLLHIWLVDVPPMAVLFLRFSLIEAFAVVNGEILYDIIQANGKLRRYNIEVSLYGGLVFPLVWLAFHFGAPVWAAYPIYIFIYLTLTLIRLHCIAKLTNYRWQSFISDVVVPGIKVLSLSLIVPISLTILMQDSLLRFFVLIIATLIWMGVIILFVGFNSTERAFVIRAIRSKLSFKGLRYDKTA